MLRAIISAPREMRCSSIPQRYMISNVPSTFRASERAIMMPLRNPIKISSTPITIASAIRKLMIKPFTEWPTSAA
ncbi:hypothetical protein D3C81_1304020 [compost metagenome]